MEDIKKKIADFLNNHNEIHLATVDSDFKPWVSTVAYAFDGDKSLYFFTDSNSLKIKNLKGNQDIAFATPSDGNGWLDIVSLQFQGKAYLVTGHNEMESAGALLFAKFPQMAQMPKSQSMTAVRIELTEGYLLDYTKGFMNREKVTY